MSAVTMYPPGDFSFMKSINMIEMLTDAYKAISETNSWDLLKEDPSTSDLLFSDDPRIHAMNSALKYSGHSGGSYQTTMQYMKYIAFRGWNAYCDHMIASD